MHITPTMDLEMVTLQVIQAKEEVMGIITTQVMVMEQAIEIMMGMFIAMIAEAKIITILKIIIHLMAIVISITQDTEVFGIIYFFNFEFF